MHLPLNIYTHPYNYFSKVNTWKGIVFNVSICMFWQGYKVEHFNQRYPMQQTPRNCLIMDWYYGLLLLLFASYFVQGCKYTWHIIILVKFILIIPI